MRLLILFFCLNAEVFGQEDSLAWIPRIRLVQRSHIETALGGNYVFASPPNAIIVGRDTVFPANFGRWFIDSWDAYVKWADSLVYAPNVWAKPDSTWQKRERQPSFYGFIEWLKKQQ